MILFHADGRLGNQLFQYAFLRRLRRPGEWIISSNLGELLAAFEIDDGRIANVQSRLGRYLARKWIVPFLLRPLSRLRLVSYVGQVIDAEGTYLPALRRSNGLLPVTWVDSHYFQAESLFDLGDARRSICPRAAARTEAQSLLERLPTTSSPVFVHVRRGDYLDLPFRGANGIALPAAYYRSAIAHVRARIPDACFVFLSDDPAYVEGEFQDVQPRVVSRLSMAGDMALMSQCRGGVLSNSSFSWWGAALMREPLAIVSPKWWYGWRQRFESHPGIQPSFADVLEVC